MIRHLVFWGASTLLLRGQMPPGLPNRDSYAIRELNRKAPCRFAAEYAKSKSQKTDPRVAYIEVEKLALAADDEPLGFDSLCRALSEQTEDGLVVFDKARGFLHLIFSYPDIGATLAYFAPSDKASYGVMLYVPRREETSKAFAFAWRDNQWRDVTHEYLGPLGLQPADLLLLPQYGRTIRVMARHGDSFRHKQYLTWDGKQFKVQPASQGKAAWRCPDSFRYFNPEDRAVYCP